MTTFRADPASTEIYELGEGPVWDASANRILWVDILANRVLEGRLVGTTVEQTARHEFAGPVSAVVPSEDGSLLIAEKECLTIVSPSGEHRQGPRILPNGTTSRLNDGGCDPAGRFVVGTKSLVAGGDSEVLLRLEDDAALTTIDSDLTLSNGVAWSTDGSRLYSVDTLAQTVWIRDYDALSGMVGNRRALIRITDGFPDGLCIDTSDNLWLAVWGAGEVRAYSPDGQQLHTVRVAAPQVSSVAFVGEELDLLLITTAREDLDAEQLTRFPHSGRLFTIAVGATGLCTTPWSGFPQPNTDLASEST